MKYDHAIKIKHRFAPSSRFIPHSTFRLHKFNSKFGANGEKRRKNAKQQQKLYLHNIWICLTIKIVLNLSLCLFVRLQCLQPYIIYEISEKEKEYEKNAAIQWPLK